MSDTIKAGNLTGIHAAWIIGKIEGRLELPGRFVSDAELAAFVKRLIPEVVHEFPELMPEVSIAPMADMKHPIEDDVEIAAVLCPQCEDDRLCRIHG